MDKTELSTAIQDSKHSDPRDIFVFVKEFMGSSDLCQPPMLVCPFSLIASVGPVPTGYSLALSCSAFGSLM